MMSDDVTRLLLNFMARKRNLSAMDRQSLVAWQHWQHWQHWPGSNELEDDRVPAATKMWWHVNAWWFHTGCDVFSGLYQALH
jgi:hypothetical protein